MKRLLVGGMTYTPTGFFPLDVLIEDGRVVRIGRDISRSDSPAVLDCSGKYIVPGFADVIF